MAFNLVDLIKDQVGSAVMTQLGSALGGNSDVTEKAVGGAIPSILQGLMGSASTNNGAESLFKAVQDQDDGILSNLGDLIGGGADSPFASAGSGVLSSLLGGGALGNLASAVAGFSGLGKGSSNSLMGLLAPVIFSVIKRKVLGGGLNAASLASMMMGQKDNIAAAMPAGLSEQLSSSGFLDSIGDTLKGGTDSVTSAAVSAGDAVSDTASAAVSAVSDTAGAAVNAAGDAVGAVGDAAADTAKAGGSLIGKLLPLIVIGAAAFFGLKMCSGSGTETRAVETTSTAPAAVTQEVISSEQALADEATQAELTVVPVATVSAFGTYNMTIATADNAAESVLTLNADGTGSLTNTSGTLELSNLDVVGDTVSFDVVTGDTSMKYTGVMTGDVFSGIMTGPDGQAQFSGTRN